MKQKQKKLNSNELKVLPLADLSHLNYRKGKPTTRNTWFPFSCLEIVMCAFLSFKDT